jgi:hypothetical protein
MGTSELQKQTNVNIQEKGLFTKLSNHLEKHGWFYGEVVGLLGTAVLQVVQG